MYNAASDSSELLRKHEQCAQIELNWSAKTCPFVFIFSISDKVKFSCLFIFI